METIFIICDAIGDLDCRKPIISKFCKKLSHFEKFCKSTNQTDFKHVKEVLYNGYQSSETESDESTLKTNYAEKESIMKTKPQKRMEERYPGNIEIIDQ